MGDGADDARDDNGSNRHKDPQDSARKLAANDDTVPMAKEPSSGPGVKRSKIEAICRADAEAEEKALKRARLLEEGRAAKKASSTPETRETVEALTVPAPPTTS